jgi:predicted nuclease of predicted toxin-antitoxin system
MSARKKKSKKPSGTSPEQLLNETTFFVDWCLGRKVGEALQAVGLTVEFHGDNFRNDAEDTEWIQVIGDREWVALTKDKAIRKKPAERERVISAKARLFTLPSGNLSGEEMAEIFVKNRYRMAYFINRHPAPFIAVVSLHGIRLLDPPVA